MSIGKISAIHFGVDDICKVGQALVDIEVSDAGKTLCLLINKLYFRDDDIFTFDYCIVQITLN